jgi:hypothetical protein
MKKIIFTNTMGVETFPPTPATKAIPEWYKKTETYINGVKMAPVENLVKHTIKKCIPVFDAITAGYILYTPVDVYISQVDGRPYYNWASQLAISFHNADQAHLHPQVNTEQIPKWTNHWAIETEKGYSSLFIPPMHHPNKHFSILPGLVDTDIYTGPVNFPFILHDSSFEGLIPAGTPMAQIIPIKRDEWKMHFGGKNEINKARQIEMKLKTKFFNSYKTLFWNKKEYL